MTTTKALTETRPPKHTPWGDWDDATKLAEGIWSVSTPSHGGIWLDATRRAELPTAEFWNEDERGGWYEEDCAWSIPMVWFAEAIGQNAPDSEAVARSQGIARAREIIVEWCPDEAAKVLGRTIEPRESHILRDRILKASLKPGAMVLRSATGSQDRGFVAVSFGPMNDRAGDGVVYLMEPAAYSAFRERGDNKSTIRPLPDPVPSCWIKARPCPSGAWNRWIAGA